jgi:hypothetical protein
MQEYVRTDRSGIDQLPFGPYAKVVALAVSDANPAIVQCRHGLADSARVPRIQIEGAVVGRRRCIELVVADFTLSCLVLRG